MSELPKPFTLLQVTPDLETGGVEQTTVDIARAVTAEGGRALVASRGGRLEAALAQAGGELVRAPVHSKNPVVILLNAFALARLIRKEKVDLVHVRSRAPAFSAFVAARLTGVPLAATYHGVYSARGPLKRWYNAVMTRGDLVIANSAWTRDHVIAEHGVSPERVVAVPRGVDLERFDPATVPTDRLDALRRTWNVPASERRTVFLLAGRLTRWKGQSLIVQAAALLKARGRNDFLILLAGDDQGRSGYRAELQAEIAASGLEDRVRLTGHCADMPAAYLLADVALAPSVRPEAFGRTAVEPQAMGRPVIAAAHGATVETVVDGETGRLVAPGDASAWADAIGSFAEADAETRAAMGRAGRARVEALFSVQAMCRTTLDLYARTLADRRSARSA